MTQNDSTVSEPLLKFISVWAAVGITSWADAAAFFATVYSIILIGEWFYKKMKRKA